MNNLLLSIKKSPKYLAYPFLFSSAFLLIVNALNLFPLKKFEQIYLLSQANIEIIFGASAVFFVCLYSSESSKKAFAGAISYAMGDLVYFSFSKEHYSLLFSVVIAFVFSKLIKNLDLLYAFALLLIVSVAFSMAVGFCYDYLYSVLRSFCSFMKNKKMLFCTTNDFYSIAFSDKFGDMFYTKDYSLATFVDGEIVAGVKNVFLADTEARNDMFPVFLSGKYFVNLFVTLGVFVALLPRFNNEELYAFSLVVIISLIFGDTKLLSLFLLVFNPMIYVAFLVMVFVSYLIAMLLDIQMGFKYNGSVIELFLYGEKFAYIFLAGMVVGVMAYFLIQLFFSKFDIEKRKILPKEVRKIVNALGGEKNIRKIVGDKLYVKNPNLINTLSLDCDIMENEITLHFGELDLLKNYF